jgi:hypothetical protein
VTSTTNNVRKLITDFLPKGNRKLWSFLDGQRSSYNIDSLDNYRAMKDMQVKLEEAIAQSDGKAKDIYRQYNNKIKGIIRGGFTPKSSDAVLDLVKGLPKDKLAEAVKNMKLTDELKNELIKTVWSKEYHYGTSKYPHYRNDTKYGRNYQKLMKMTPSEFIMAIKG